MKGSMTKAKAAHNHKLCKNSAHIPVSSKTQIGLNEKFMEHLNIDRTDEMAVFLGCVYGVASGQPTNFPYVKIALQ